jgi:hypothetical protein
MTQTVLSLVRRAREMASAKKDHPVETALGLFPSNGFHATGIVANPLKYQEA